MRKKIILFFLIFLLIIIFPFFWGNPPKVEKIDWGVVFSQKHVQLLGLNWKENYLMILDDLKTKNIKIITHWDLIEPQKDNYFFDDLDWQISEAEKRGVKIILVIGMKTGRWPECHLPYWAKNLEKDDQQKEILELIKEIVLKYKDSPSLIIWQVENEPFFKFGECPWYDEDFLKKEINLVRSLDKKPVLISDSGEFSFWTKAAKLGDIVGTTLHRRVWVKEIKIFLTHHWFRPIYYWQKTKIIEKIFGKKVICVELQAEPWCKSLLYNCSLEEQKITMDFKKFKENIEFAKKTGLDTFYFWGVEWWYWLKTKQNQPEIWQEAKNYLK